MREVSALKFPLLALPLVRLLRGSAEADDYTAAEWSDIMADARTTSLGAQLAFLVRDNAAFLGTAPANLAEQLRSAAVVAAGHRRAMRWEVERVAAALAPLEGVPTILLKGGAYRALDLPFARERLFGDIDILVPEASLSAVETRLRVSGWRQAHQSAYDQRYYRRWMHELPPMEHVHRGTTIDVHHRLVPRTSRIKVDHAPLFANPMPVPGFSEVYTLAAPAMLLHSALHLYTESEFDQGLRNLFDVHHLITHYSAADAGFADELMALAEASGLQQVLVVVSALAQAAFGTALPTPLAAAVRQLPKGRTERFARIFGNAVHPHRRRYESGRFSFARFVLFVRGHYLRMPFHLLIPHLAHKALERFRGEESEGAQKPQA